jgi:hypothetical protein
MRPTELPETVWRAGRSRVAGLRDAPARSPASLLTKIRPIPPFCTQYVLQLKELPRKSLFFSSLTLSSTSPPSTALSHSFGRPGRLSQQPFGVSEAVPHCHQSACWAQELALAPLRAFVVRCNRATTTNNPLTRGTCNTTPAAITPPLSAQSPGDAARCSCGCLGDETLHPDFPQFTDARFRRQDNNPAPARSPRTLTAPRNLNPICRPRRTDGLQHMVHS